VTREEFEQALLEHAAALESAVALAQTRIEHIRVSSLALEARRLADVFTSRSSSAA
jgi:GrpB-like predicted nucleotidyltransferase (UPF0157 family)